MVQGECPICGSHGVELNEHHVVEAIVESGKTPSINMCSPCHDQQEKYRNNLLNICHIDIDNRKKS